MMLCRTVLLSSRFQCATVWGKKEFKYEFVRANGLDSYRELEFLLHRPAIGMKRPRIVWEKAKIIHQLEHQT